MEKIDAHSHFYKAFAGPSSDIETFLRESKDLNIVAAIASPGPCPEYKNLTGEMYRPCVWNYDVVRKEFRYMQQYLDIENGTILQQKPSNINPYGEINRRLLEDAQTNNSRQNTQILVMPLHHPFLDSIEEVEELLADDRSIALKLHGIATASGPKDVSAEIVALLKKYDKPIIVHTDTYRSTPTNPLHITYQKNLPDLWVQWAIDHQVKTLITHGARLSSTAIEQAKGRGNIKIGVSPDLLITSEPLRLVEDSSDFLTDLIAKASPDQLVWDIDYGWNVSERNNWDKRDWKMCERLETLVDQLGYTTSDLRRIYYDNSMNFYNLGKRRTQAWV